RQVQPGYEAAFPQREARQRVLWRRRDPGGRMMWRVGTLREACLKNPPALQVSYILYYYFITFLYLEGWRVIVRKRQCKKKSKAYERKEGKSRKKLPTLQDGTEDSMTAEGYTVEGTLQNRVPNPPTLQCTY
ncbi:hypothetical protein, partial [Oceanidesulfovibrio indonesiensis]|uniref:hypothetical protein n=1 Tax=Oceanidesulfovibrio indonesiensis TaxID=54767 RepID=UPI001ABF1954